MVLAVEEGGEKLWLRLACPFVLAMLRGLRTILKKFEFFKKKFYQPGTGSPLCS